MNALEYDSVASSSMPSSRPVIVTGSCGLIGSEVVSHLCKQGYAVIGIDNNQRSVFFGPEGDTASALRRLHAEYPENYTHCSLDIRDRERILALFKDSKPAAIVHTAAQPSHDRAAAIPFDDFEVNAVGTLNLLEATRQFSLDSPFVFFSTNKVYGDLPNQLPLSETPFRWNLASSEYLDGIPETFSIDQSTHSLFGVSKLSADLLVQEYGRYFGIPTCCLRGGCLTGPNHAGVELHGFLSYMGKCAVYDRTYRIYGYKGKQVRDNIHSHDVSQFVSMFIDKPRISEVYNLGGGFANSCSLLEAVHSFSELTGRPLATDYIDENRVGDHICYYSDLSKIKAHYPDWEVRIKLPQIFAEIVCSWHQIKASR